MPNIEIKLDALGRGTFKVDDQDIASVVERVVIEARAGDLTEIHVTMRGPLTLELKDALLHARVEFDETE